MSIFTRVNLTGLPVQLLIVDSLKEQKPEKDIGMALATSLKTAQNLTRILQDAATKAKHFALPHQPDSLAQSLTSLGMGQMYGFYEIILTKLKCRRLREWCWEMEMYFPPVPPHDNIGQ